MENKELKDYLIKGKINIDSLLDDFYNDVYMIVKNKVSIYITDEDIEEIISDVFLAIWKNSSKLSNTTPVKAYLTGITKNVIKNKYRKTQANISISDYEEKIVYNFNLEELKEEKEKNAIMQKELKKLREEEYNIFLMFYYEGKTIKQISENLKCSASKVKTILHRVRKKLKRKLEDGGYGYGK